MDYRYKLLNYAQFLNHFFNQWFEHVELSNNPHYLHTRLEYQILPKDLDHLSKLVPTLIASYYKNNSKTEFEQKQISNLIFLKRAHSTETWSDTWVKRIHEIFNTFQLYPDIEKIEIKKIHNICVGRESFSEYVNKVLFLLKTELSLTDNLNYHPIISTLDCFTSLNYEKGGSPFNMKETFFIDQDHVLTSHLTPYFVKDKLLGVGSSRNIGYYKCYRRENPDKTHLCEFNQLQVQIKSVSKDPSMELKQLFLRIYELLGLDLNYIEFRTTHYPYVSPAYQIYYTKKGFIELGGCGVMMNSVLKTHELYLAGAVGLERCYSLVYDLNTIAQVHPLIHK